ncbi:hypothetical protein FA95DRAFT_508266 [Auriscalpium vulgare]|uniref:Uncharacterized protein n=1 Tax=Auriscalpium vulgare TaxID=40419 RepID=A0ACB8RGB3_9AGAM|nr:hypothetical protein FA95DRAFT_508266 [Auriscalpium vulgare]
MRQASSKPHQARSRFPDGGVNNKRCKQRRWVLSACIRVASMVSAVASMGLGDAVSRMMAAIALAALGCCSIETARENGQTESG